MLRFGIFVTAVLGVSSIVFHYQLSLHARERGKKPEVSSCKSRTIIQEVQCIPAPKRKGGKKERKKMRTRNYKSQHARKHHRGERRRAISPLLLLLALFSPAHRTALDTQGRRTSNDWTSFLLPKDVNAKVFSGLAVQELEHYFLLLRSISMAD